MFGFIFYSKKQCEYELSKDADIFYKRNEWSLDCLEDSLNYASSSGNG